jgi:hypothetical protein
MRVFWFFPDFYVFWNGASSSTRGGVWLLLTTPPLLQSDSVGARSFTPTFLAQICPVLKSQSYFTTGGLPPNSSSWRQAPWDSRPVIFSQLNTCGYSPYVTSSLTRGWVCRFQLLLALAGRAILGLSPAGLTTTFYCLRFETPLTWRTRSPYLYPPGTGWPRHRVPFPSPSTTRRADLLS